MANISEVFQDVHVQLMMNDLDRVVDNFNEVKKRFDLTLSLSDLEKMFKDTELDSQYLFATKEKGWYPYWYIKDDAYIEIPVLAPDFLEMMQVKKREKAINDEVEKDLKEGRFDVFPAYIPTSFQFCFFQKHLSEIPKNKIYETFRSLYILNEYDFNRLGEDVTRRILSSNSKHAFRKSLPTDSEGYITIYRGVGEKSTPIQKAYSWTLDFQVALFFATRFNSSNPSIYRARVLPEDVIDYIESRNEKEVLVFYEKLTKVEDLNLYTMDEDFTDELIKEGVIEKYQSAIQILKPSWFFDPTGIHGLLHMKRVTLLSLIQSYLGKLSEGDERILVYASLTHDVGRFTNDYDQGKHGILSVKKIKGIKLHLHLSKEEQKILFYIIENHSLDDEVGFENLGKESIQDKERALRLYKIFKDSDCLDRVRLDREEFDVRYLRSDIAKKLVIVAEQLLKNLR